jgi:hypothetical protein
MTPQTQSEKVGDVCQIGDRLGNRSEMLLLDLHLDTRIADDVAKRIGSHAEPT